MLRSTSLTVLAALAFACSARAQRQPHFDRITVEDGLPGRQVLALLQDREGFVWLGTDNGLARHEGVRIRSWHHDRYDRQSLSNEQVNCIAEDGRGHLWVGTANGISRLDPSRSTFQRYALPAADADVTRANRVRDLLCDVDGMTWVSTELGLYILDPASGEARYVEDADVERVGPPSTRIAKHALVRDTLRQGIWLGTEKGLAFHHLPTGAWYHVGHDPLEWACFTDADAGSPLPLADGSLLWFDQRTLALMHADLRGSMRVLDHLAGERIAFTPRFLAQDPDGTIWLSTWTYRLYRMNADLTDVQRIDDTPGLPGAMVEKGPYSTLMDRSGVRWFGAAEGLALLAPWRQGMQVVRPMPGSALMGVVAQHGDSLLVGTQDHGLLIVDLRRNSVRRILPDSGDVTTDLRRWARRISCALHMERDQYLIGSGLGLHWLDLRQGTLRPALERLAQLGYQLPDGLRRSSITRLKRDLRGRLWVGTWTRGVFRAANNGETVHFHSKAQDPAWRLPMNGVLDILVARNGDVWLGLNDGGGLIHLRGGEGPGDPRYQVPGSDAFHAVVMALAEGHDGSIWSGTHQGGLDRIHPGTHHVTHWTRREGLPSDRIGAVLTDDKGEIWTVTSAGVARLPLDAKRFIALEPPQGISPLHFLSRTMLLEDGRLALANNDQLLLVAVGAGMAPMPVPEVRMVEVLSGEGRISAGHGPLRLPYDRRTVVVHAATIGHGGLGGIVFRYHIPGITPEPQDMSPTGRLDLIDLPAGDHGVEITASLDGRLWSATPTILQLTILPPFWATWWFRSLIVLAIGLTVYLAVRSYVGRKLAAQRIAFEREQALLAERVRIASDMHDDLGAGLSGLKLRAELALRKEQDPQKRSQLESLAGMAGELMGNMRRIIWTMDGGQGTLEDLVAYCSNYARQYLSEHGIGCSVEVANARPRIQVSSELRRNFFLVMKEALHNVVKHAGAREVVLGIRVERGELVLEVADDGQGMGPTPMKPAADAGSGKGLRNMRQRMEQLGGHLEMNGAMPGRGTLVRGRVPLHNAEETS